MGYRIRCTNCERFEDLGSCKKCQRGHVFCRSCSQESFYLIRSDRQDCPRCGSALVEGTAHIRSGFSRAGSLLVNAAWGSTFGWWLYLFRNPDIIVLCFAWLLSLIILFGTGRASSLVHGFQIWVVGSAIAAIAPILTLLFVRRKRSGLGFLGGWMLALRGDMTMVWYIVVAVAALYAILRIAA
jgi:hypothetical protein